MTRIANRCLFSSLTEAFAASDYCQKKGIVEVQGKDGEVVGGEQRVRECPWQKQALGFNLRVWGSF